MISTIAGYLLLLVVAICVIAFPLVMWLIFRD
jgi:hypothetical protein